MRRIERLLLASAGAAAAYGAFLYQPMLNIARPAVLATPAVVASPSPRLARRVVWVLIDGLRLDASRRMPTLNRLRTEGQDVEAHSEFPTYTVPNLVTQASGIEPAASGVRTNDYAGRIPLDSVFERAKLAGLATSVTTTATSFRAIRDLFNPWVDEIRVGGPIPEFLRGDLAFVHLDFTDLVGHAHGAASREYAEAVERADAILASVVDHLDPAQDALVVTSDHGHIDRGGHGGVEPDVIRIPLVLWGAGVPSGPPRYGASGRDVGPTIVHLLGLPPLRHATGRSLLGEDPEAARRRAAVAMALAHANEVSASVGVVGAAPLFVVVLIALGEMPIRLRAWRTSPVYLLTYGVLLAATHTLTFSVSNNAAWFGARILALGILSTLAQIAAGGRDSLVPASLLTVLAVAVPITILPTELRHLPSPTLSFLPIPGLAGAGVLCTLAAGLAPSRASRAVTTERRPTGALTRTPTIRP